jgi:heme A synthase
MLVVQVALGVATVVNVVPLPLAALHQAGAVVLFGLSLAVAHAARGSAAAVAHLPNRAAGAMMGDSSSKRFQHG